MDSKNFDKSPITERDIVMRHKELMQGIPDDDVNSCLEFLKPKFVDLAKKHPTQQDSVRCVMDGEILLALNSYHFAKATEALLQQGMGLRPANSFESGQIIGSFNTIYGIHSKRLEEKCGLRSRSWMSRLDGSDKK